MIAVIWHGKTHRILDAFIVSDGAVENQDSGSLPEDAHPDARMYLFPESEVVNWEGVVARCKTHFPEVARLIQGSNAWRELERHTEANVRAIQKLCPPVKPQDREAIRDMVYDIMKAERKARR